MSDIMLYVVGIGVPAIIVIPLLWLLGKWVEHVMMKDVRKRAKEGIDRLNKLKI